MFSKDDHRPLIVIYRLDSRTFWPFFLAKALPLWERGVKMDKGGKTFAEVACAVTGV